jgi:hypothetical protein
MVTVAEPREGREPGWLYESLRRFAYRQTDCVWFAGACTAALGAYRNLDEKDSTGCMTLYVLAIYGWARVGERWFGPK